jgi:hypothetical protein
MGRRKALKSWILCTRKQLGKKFKESVDRLFSDRPHESEGLSSGENAMRKKESLQGGEKKTKTPLRLKAGKSAPANRQGAAPFFWMRRGLPNRLGSA